MQPERLVGRAEEFLDVDREVRLIEPDGVLVGADEVVLVAPLPGVEDAADRAEEDRERNPTPGSIEER